MVRSLWAFLRLSRPHFLLGGGLMFALGAVTAGRFDPVGYALGQLMVTAGQVTAHYVNEYADVEADRGVEHRTLFSGGSGVLAGEMLPARVALRAAWVSTALTGAAAAGLAGRSPVAALLGLVAVAISWSYSMPPLRLLGTGWGELAASLVVAVIVPVIGASAQAATPTPALWWSVAILLPVHLAMMLVFELPDLDTDRAAGKRVLAVRIGRRNTMTLVRALLVGAVAVVASAALTGGLPPAAARWTLLGVPAAVTTLVALSRRRHGILTASAVAILVLVATGLLIGLTR